MIIDFNEQINKMNGIEFLENLDLYNEGMPTNVVGEDESIYTTKQVVFMLEKYCDTKSKSLNIGDVSNCCPICESTDFSTSHRCNECSNHFDKVLN